MPVSISQLVVGALPTMPPATMVSASVIVEASSCWMLPPPLASPVELPLIVSKRKEVEVSAGWRDCTAWARWSAGFTGDPSKPQSRL